jgi:hypothetical protein
MDTPMFRQAVILLLLAAGSYTIAHGGRLLMHRARWPVWIAGTAFGFVAFLVSRVALAGAAWVVYSLLFGSAPHPWALVALVGVASAPLLLSFVNLTPFYGPGVMRMLYVISLIWLTSATSGELNMDWLGCLGWWVAAWLLLAGVSFALTWALRNARWLAWTGVLGPFRTTSQAVMAEMPGMKDARWSEPVA